MNARDVEILNARNRMTPEQRAEEIVREIFGPTFAAIFPHVTPPIAPTEPESKNES